jgi:ribosomal protein S18 acetylase RimI-like enzyme
MPVGAMPIPTDLDRSINAQFDVRPLDIRRDLDALGELLAIAFADDATTVGSDLRAEVRMLKKLVPVVTILRLVSAAFRHIFDGFVIEEQGRFVSMVVAGRSGAKSKRWQIGNVATHPDYRRRGLARRLVNRAIEHAQSLGAEMCLLEVRAENTPAYNLYRSQGFDHYDSTTVMKLEDLPAVRFLPADGYTVRSMKYREWKPRYELARLEAPQAVQSFVPVSEEDFHVSALEQLIEPVVRIAQKVDVHRWAVERDGQLVGTLSLAARRAKAKVFHSIAMRILPQHRPVLAEPMLTLALQTLQSYPLQTTRTQIRTSYADQIETFKRHGFVEIEVTHRLGLHLD